MQSHHSKPARVLCCTSSWLQGRHGRRSGDVGRCMGHHASTEPEGREKRQGWLTGWLNNETFTPLHTYPAVVAVGAENPAAQPVCVGAAVDADAAPAEPAAAPPAYCCELLHSKPMVWFDPAQMTTSNTQQKFGQPQRSTSTYSGRVGYIRCLGCGHNCRVVIKSTRLFVLAVAVLHCIATRFARSPSNLPQSGAQHRTKKKGNVTSVGMSCRLGRIRVVEPTLTPRKQHNYVLLLL